MQLFSNCSTIGGVSSERSACHHAVSLGSNFVHDGAILVFIAIDSTFEYTGFVAIQIVFILVYA